MIELLMLFGAGVFVGLLCGVLITLILQTAASSDRLWGQHPRKR